MEIRQDNAVAPGGGVNGSVSANRRSSGALYYSLGFGYLGTNELGFLRFGSTYGPLTLLSVGTFENFNDGGWNGDVNNALTGGTNVTYPFATASGYYTSEKLVYLSPQFYGIDGSISFEPSTVVDSNSSGNCPYGVTAASASGIQGPISGGAAGLGCNAAASTSSGDYARRRSTVDLALRYRNAFGPVGLAVEAGGVFSGRVTDDATPARAVQYDNQRVADGGLMATYDGFALGGHIIAGRVNGALGSLDPRGEKDEFVWLTGTSYAFGPFIVGASYYDLMSAGSKTAATSPYVGNRNEVGVAAGGTYSFAPGMNLFLSYLYGQRKELGVDLLSGALSTATAKVVTHNNVQGQVLAIGSQFRW